MKSFSDEVVELKVVYDATNPEDLDIEDCAIGRNYSNAQNPLVPTKTCTIEFRTDRDMAPPILVYYELTKFHQNHRSYYKSRDDYQLTGSVTQFEGDVENCDPVNQLGDIKINPCGKIANTFFNDKFYVESGVEAGTGAPLVMFEEGIAWQSDITYRFKQPNGFDTTECDAIQCDNPSNSTCCQDLGYSCIFPVYSKKDKKCYAYTYPNDDTTQYLYETYPNIVSPLEGVTNEHFIVWMRIATLPTFRKLYGYIDQPIAAGTRFSFKVESNYVVESFGGSKALIMTTNNVFGGKNDSLGVTFFTVGFFCLGVGVLYAIKHWFRPRKLANVKYLNFKEE